jgi:SPFH domain / Band 7 family
MRSAFLSRALTRPSLLSLSRVLPAPLQSAIPTTTFRRFKGSYIFDGVGGGGAEDMWEWPITKMNTIFNIVPQGHRYVVERFGKLHEVHESGWFLAIPLVDRIAYVIDVRERALDIAPQAAITRDNGRFPLCMLHFCLFNELVCGIFLQFVSLILILYSSFRGSVRKSICAIYGRQESRLRRP